MLAIAIPNVCSDRSLYFLGNSGDFMFNICFLWLLNIFLEKCKSKNTGKLENFNALKNSYLCILPIGPMLFQIWKS